MTPDMRQFFPKGTDLSNLIETTPKDVAWFKNDRPRKTPVRNIRAESMANERAAIKSTVALQT